MGATIPLEPFHALRRDVDQLFERFLPLLPLDASTSTHLPRLEVVQEEGVLLARLDLPGLKPGEIEVEVGPDSATVRAATTSEVAEGPGDPAARRTYYRAFSLPRGARPEQASATFDGEVLTLRIPVEASPVPHRIPVQPAEAR